MHNEKILGSDKNNKRPQSKALATFRKTCSLQMNADEGKIEGWDSFWNHMAAEGNMSQDEKVTIQSRLQKKPKSVILPSAEEQSITAEMDMSPKPDVRSTQQFVIETVPEDPTLLTLTDKGLKHQITTDEAQEFVDIPEFLREYVD